MTTEEVIKSISLPRLQALILEKVMISNSFDELYITMRFFSYAIEKIMKPEMIEEINEKCRKSDEEDKNDDLLNKIINEGDKGDS